MFKLALVQMKVRGGRPDANLRRGLAFVAEAAAAGAQVVVLPEAFTLGWTDPSALAMVEAVPGGPACQALAGAAAEHGVFVCAGLVERAGERVYNTAVLVGPGGEVLLAHRKIYELEVAHGLYALGDRLGVVETPLGTFGLMVCADALARGEVVGRTLALMGADVILSPSSWAVRAEHDGEPYGQLWVDRYGAIARDFRVWVAGASNVGRIEAGPWRGRKCIGCSLVVGPDGRPVLRGPYGEDAEEVLYVDVSPGPRPARGTGWEGALGG